MIFARKNGLWNPPGIFIIGVYMKNAQKPYFGGEQGRELSLTFSFSPCKFLHFRKSIIQMRNSYHVVARGGWGEFSVFFVLVFTKLSDHSRAYFELNPFWNYWTGDPCNRIVNLAYDFRPNSISFYSITIINHSYHSDLDCGCHWKYYFHLQISWLNCLF